MNFVTRQILFHAVLPLFIGFLIYIFFRPEVWFIQFLQKREPLIILKEMNPLQKLLIFSGPDFCWAYSLSSALLIWYKWMGRTINHFGLLVLILVILSELLQLFFPSIFTFGWFDLIAALLAFTLSYLVICGNEKD